MLKIERKQQILSLLARRKTVRLGELCSLLNASVATIRRDLTQMEAEGLIHRVHGGALFTGDQLEPSVSQRRAAQAEGKRRIARAAAYLVKDGETILITGGTTTEAMTPFLASRKGLTVITNAINIANQFTRCPHICVVVLGGWLRHSELSLVGHLTEGALRDFRAEKVFYSVYGLDPEVGLTGSDVQEAQTDRCLIQSAGSLVVLADRTKFHRVGSVRLAPAAAISTLITETGVSEECVLSLREKGIQVIQV